MKSPIETEVSTAPTTTTTRGGRGRGRGRGRGSATTASTVAAANSSSRRRSSETSTDSMSNKSLTTTATPSATGATTVATSVFDWEEDESEMMASPTLRKENAKNKTMQQQNQLSIDTGNESTSGKKELESTSSSTPVKSPNVQPPTTKAATPNRQRRSTGSNSRSSKESAGEDEVIISPSTAANSASAQATNNKQETEEKIKAILEQAKQQQEQTAALGLLKEVVQPQQQPQAVAVAATPVSTPAHHPLPAAQVTATSPTAAALIQVQQRPTVLTTRMPVSSANQPGAAAVPITSTAATTTLAFPTQPHSMRPQVVQLPTQPIPPSEIARQTTKQVLLEPKAGASGGVTASAQAASQAQAAASAAGSQQNKMVSPNKLVAIPTTSPRGPVPAATSITLPTQPVPMSQTQLNSVTNSIVAKTMAMSMLPNQPLPPQHQPMTVLAAAQAQAQAQAQQQQQQQHQQQQQQQPKLPQHPVPPVMPPTSATSITLVPAPNNRSASPVKPQHVALKKREYMASALAAAAASNAEHNHNKDVMHIDQKPPVGLGGPEQHQQPSVSSPAPPPTSVYPNPRKDHMKPRDAFGRGAHLIKEEPKPSLQQQQQQHSQAIKPLHQPPPPSSPSLPSLDQLIMMRDQEMQMVYQSLIKQGNTEQMATYVASQMATERYKSAIDQILQLNNERPSSRDHHVGGPPGGHHGGPGDAFNAPIAHAHSRHPNPYVHDPFNRGAAAAAAAAMINLNSSGGPLGGPVVPGQPGGQVTSQVPRQPPPSSPEPTEFAYPSLEAYPVVWQGHLGLKNESASVQFHYISGCKELARNSLPLEPIPHMATLRIGQRMRLEDAHLSGVRTKMQQNGEHCVLLALPCGKDPSDVEAQSRQLREHFITYLQLKGAAGIVNVPGVEGGYVVHVFPSCDFANETMTSIAPDLLARVAEIEHMVIVIATVLDKAAASMT